MKKLPQTDDKAKIKANQAHYDFIGVIDEYNQQEGIDNIFECITYGHKLIGIDVYNSQVVNENVEQSLLLWIAEEYKVPIKYGKSHADFPVHKTKAVTDKANFGKSPVILNYGSPKTF